MNNNKTKNNSNETATNDYGTTARLLNEAESAAADLARIYGITDLITLKTNHPDRAVLIIAKAGGKCTTIRYGLPAEAADALAHALAEDTRLADAARDLWTHLSRQS